MKKTIVLVSMFFCLSSLTYAQNLREKAESMAQNDFSKSKHKREERHGVVKEKSKTIQSIPVLKELVAEYAGNYESKSANVSINLYTNNLGKLEGTMTKDGQTYMLKNVIAKDAYFKAINFQNNGIIEGVFINKMENEVAEFGLGVKLMKSKGDQHGGYERIFLKATNK